MTIKPSRKPFVFVSIFYLIAWNVQVAGGKTVQPTQNRHGMVTSAHPLATQTGLYILKQGGNEVDAAAATALAISVVTPFSAGIGGGGFMLLKRSDTDPIKALDFREKAPLKATSTMYLNAQGKVKPKASTDGYLGTTGLHRQ